ncbi:MAG TPA: zinc-binding dehydrogenase [Clostridia bacterium]|nr:zinc-binding dehydrogenase [Clostridia bacterium]
MRACILEDVSKFVVKDIEMPEPVEDDDILMKVEKVGICGSDISMWKNKNKIGLIMGHEFCGTVVDPRKSEYKVGDRLVVIPKGPRGYSSTPGIVAPGAFAEYFNASSKYVRRLPDTISDNAANMIEPTGIAYNALKKSKMEYGDKVLVTGAGIIGLLAAEWARVMGASYIAMTDVSNKRIGKAKELSAADDVFDAKDEDLVNILNEASKGGFDVVIECTAAEKSVNMCLDVIKDFGTYVFVGVSYKPLSINTLKFVMKNITMIGTFGSSTVFDKVIELLDRKPFDLEKYITKEIGLDEIQEAFEELNSGNSDQIKIVVTPFN